MRERGREVLGGLEAIARVGIVVREDIVRVIIMAPLLIALGAFLVLLDNGLANQWREV